MKIIFKIIYSVIFISLISFSLVAGQEKKTEQKIKIVLSDDSGNKVLIDTILKDDQIKDSIILKDGNIIIKGYSGKDHGFRSYEGDDHIFVTLSSNNTGRSDRSRETTIVSSEPIVMDGAGIEQEGSSDDKTRYVIAKDGMVITVEGGDEARVKDLIKDIEKNLGVKSNSDNISSQVKVDTNKRLKK